MCLKKNMGRGKPLRRSFFSGRVGIVLLSVAFPCLRALKTNQVLACGCSLQESRLWRYSKRLSLVSLTILLLHHLFVSRVNYELLVSSKSVGGHGRHMRILISR